MGSDRPDELIAYARDLERRDADVAARIDEAGDLLRRVDNVKARAHRARVAIDALPDQVRQVEQAVTEAEAREEELRREALEANRRLEAVRGSRRAGEDARSAAEREVRRTRVIAADAGAAVARQQERLGALRSDQVALRAEADGLAVEVGEVAHDVSELPRISDSGRVAPGTSLEAIEEWGARAHAAIFVVRGGLESERERLVLEASALATSALGEQVAGSSVALVRRRLEQALAGS